LLHSLSPFLRSEVESLPSTYKDLTQGIESDQTNLSAIHPSWFSPILRSLPSKEIVFFLGATATGQRAALKKELLLKGMEPTLKQKAKIFLQKKLWQKIADKGDLLPIECLPASRLNFFLAFTQEQIFLFANALGMHDLALEIRQIIDTTKLKQIHKALSPMQERYLKTLILKKEPLAFTPMGLIKWDGNEEALKQQILQRGFNRLAKALFKENSSFLWYFLHRLDPHPASLFQKLSTPLEHPQAIEILTHQIEELALWMKKEGS